MIFNKAELSKQNVVFFGWTQTIYFILTSLLITMIVYMFDGYTLLSIFLFSSVLYYLLTGTSDYKLGITSWVKGIPLYYGLMFLLLPLSNWIIQDIKSISEQEMAYALSVATVGLIAFGVGTKLALRYHQNYYGFSTIKNTVFETIQQPRVLVSSLILGILSTFWSYFWGYYGLRDPSDDIGNTAGFISALSFLLTMSHLASWNVFFRTQDKKYLWMGLVSANILLISGVFSNSKTALILPLFFIGISYWGVRGKFPYKLSLLSLLMFLFIAFPFVTVSRYVIFISGNNLSKLEIAKTTLDYLISFDWRNQIESYSEYGVVKSMGRGLIEYFSVIIHETGKSVDFLYGKTFTHGIEAFIPRFIYPEKLGLTIGNWTAQHYGLLSPDDIVTSVSPTLMGEFYMNYGVYGIIIGMAFIGCLSVWIDRYIIISKDNWVMPYAIFCIGWQESLIGQTFIPFIKNILFLWFVFFIIYNITKISDAIKH